MGSVMGAGLLVGTALSVIIPEGMQTLNMAYSIKEHASHHGGEGTEESGHAHQHEENPVPHIIGVSLVLGFIFMLIVDQVANAMSASRDVEVGKGRGVVSWTATLGLVVHAAADGVALVTYLLHEGLDKPRIKRHLLVFSLAAPLLAIFTYLLLTLRGQGNLDTLSGTGTAMLFSAGTFLYVATVHVLPEVTNVGHGHSHGGGEGKSGFSKAELVTLVLGAILPLFLTMGHHH